MSTELELKNKEVTHRLWDIIQGGNLDELDQVLGENVLLQVPGEAEMRGIEAYRDYIKLYNQAFPDVTIEVTDMIQEDDKVVTHFMWRGTHMGEMAGIGATGKTAKAPGVTINRFRDGKVIEDINYWDNLAFMEQLGVVKSP